MSVADHIARTSKLRTVVTTVDPSQRIIEVATKDGTVRRLAIFEIPNGFRWPREGEEWTIYQENGYWYLGSPILSSEDDEQLRSLQPGQRFYSQAEVDQLKQVLGLA